MQLKKLLTIILTILTFLSLVVCLMGLGLHSMCIASDTPQVCGMIFVPISVILLILIILWCLKFKLIRQRWLQNILISLPLITGGIIVFNMLWTILHDWDDFIIYFPILLYGFLIILAASIFLVIPRH